MAYRNDVVTLYFCGSGNNRNQSDENTLPLLYERTKGERRVCFDGPGATGGPILKTEAITKMLHNQGNASTGWALTSKGKAANQAKKWHKMLTDHHGTTTTVLTGKGTQSNIVMALQWLWLEYYDEPFVDVNVAGFSRGGVSAIMLGHAIQAAGFNHLGTIRVNVFAFDPVPGSTNDFKNKGSFEATGRAGTPKTLAPVVTSYRSILQENVLTWDWGVVPKDRTFKCVVPNYTGSNPKRTERELIPMPGDHGDAARHVNSKGPGPIGAHLCQEFLQSHGTAFSSSMLLNPTGLLENYAVARQSYTKKGKAFGAKKAPSKHRVNLVVNPFRRHPFYINAHHATLMSQQHPEIAKAIDGDIALSQVQKNKLFQVLPKTGIVLANLDLI